MQNFFNIFQNGHQNKQSTMVVVDNLTLNNLRRDIMDEFKTVIDYTNHLADTSNEDVKKIYKSIRSEEQVHIGELINLLFLLDSESYENFKKGVKESNIKLGLDKND